jgi:hypothetical protein
MGVQDLESKGALSDKKSMTGKEISGPPLAPYTHQRQNPQKRTRKHPDTSNPK